MAAFVEQAGNRDPDGWGLASMDGEDAYIYREPVSPTEIVAPGVHVSSGTCVDQRVTLVASIPVTNESWQPFEENMLVCVHNGQIVDRRTA